MLHSVQTPVALLQVLQKLGQDDEQVVPWNPLLQVSQDEAEVQVKQLVGQATQLLEPRKNKKKF